MPQRALERLDEGGGLLGRAHVGARDDFDEGGAGAVQVDERAAGGLEVRVVRGLGRVLCAVAGRGKSAQALGGEGAAHVEERQIQDQKLTCSSWICSRRTSK